jgi:hypothetical protein
MGDANCRDFRWAMVIAGIVDGRCLLPGFSMGDANCRGVRWAMPFADVFDGRCPSLMYFALSGRRRFFFFSWCTDFRWAMPFADVFCPFRAAALLLYFVMYGLGFAGGRCLLPGFSMGDAYCRGFRWAMPFAGVFDGRCPALMYFALSGL